MQHKPSTSTLIQIRKKNVSPCSRLSTARGPCLSNILKIQANWFKQYHVHTNHTKNMWPWPLTY